VFYGVVNLIKHPLILICFCQEGGDIQNVKRDKKNYNSIKPPSFLDALIPIIALVVLLFSAVYRYGADSTPGPVQVALILCMMVAGLVGLKNGHIEPTTPVKESPDEATLYGIGGQRLGPTEHEVAVTG
jgi:hypothetical protein